MKIKIPILFYKDNDATLADMGIEAKEYEVKEVMFFYFDRIEQHYHNGKECTLVVNGGEQFICTYTLGQLSEKLDAEEFEIDYIKNIKSLN